MCRVDYSYIEEKRELGMTKVTDITHSIARCKLLNNSADYGALLQVKIHRQLRRHPLRASARLESSRPPFRYMRLDLACGNLPSGFT
jgi:hypothetical protein